MMGNFCLTYASPKQRYTDTGFNWAEFEHLGGCKADERRGEVLYFFSMSLYSKSAAPQVSLGLSLNICEGVSQMNREKVLHSSPMGLSSNSAAPRASLRLNFSVSIKGTIR